MNGALCLMWKWFFFAKNRCLQCDPSGVKHAHVCFLCRRLSMMQTYIPHMPTSVSHVDVCPLSRRLSLMQTSVTQNLRSNSDVISYSDVCLQFQTSATPCSDNFCNYFPICLLMRAFIQTKLITILLQSKHPLTSFISLHSLWRHLLAYTQCWHSGMTHIFLLLLVLSKSLAVPVLWRLSGQDSGGESAADSAALDGQWRTSIKEQWRRLPNIEWLLH